MDSRFSGKFVVDGSEPKEIDSMTALNALVLRSVGMSDYSNSGQLLEITVTIKTTGEKPWPKCEQLGYYGDQKCGTLIKPGTVCKEDHYHKPAWTKDAGNQDVCTTCISLNVTPSREVDATDYYNHKNKGGN